MNEEENNRREDGTTSFADYYLRQQKHKADAVTISPTDINIIKSLNRKWKINSHNIGNIEKLAQARYEVEMLSQEKLEEWYYKENGDIDEDKQLAMKNYIEPLATTVFASAEIEGESIKNKDVKIAIVGEPGRGDNEHKKEYEERMKCVRDIYYAYLYALSRKYPLEGNEVINCDFIKEIHRRMFLRTKPEIAGKFKEKANQICRDNEAVVFPLKPEDTEIYMNAICNKISEKFYFSDQFGTYSKLIAIAEFILDFLAIHPFEDGNGRIVRLLSTYLLEKAKFHFARFYSMDVIILGKRKDYYDALFNSQKNWGTIDEDLSSWIQFYIDAVYDQYVNARQVIMKKKRDEMAVNNA